MCLTIDREATKQYDGSTETYTFTNDFIYINVMIINLFTLQFGLTASMDQE